MGADQHADKELTDSKAPLSRASRMKNLLEKQFAPAMLEVIDESSRHAGHAGAAPGGETHFRLKLASAAFEGRSRLERQRLVNAVLREEFDTGLHALSLDLKTPAEI